MKGLPGICHHGISDGMNRDCHLSHTKGILHKQTAVGIDFHQHM